MYTEKAVILDSGAIDRALVRIAHEIVERDDRGELVVVGICRRGVPLAKRIAEESGLYAFYKHGKARAGAGAVRRPSL